LAQEDTCFSENRDDIYWITGSSGVETRFAPSSRVLTLPIEENFENIYLKTKAAFKWILANEEFDFLVRTNTSTYFDINRMWAELGQRESSKDYAGGEIGQTELTLEANTNKGLFLAGTGIVLSRSVVEKIIEFDDRTYLTLPDDTAISAIISELNIDFHRIARIDLTDYKAFGIGTHYRIKSWSDNNRTSERFFELHRVLTSSKSKRFKEVTVFQLKELILYIREFPANKGLNLIRILRQLLRITMLNFRTWSWIMGKNV
jgi:hypothetical protein